MNKSVLTNLCSKEKSVPQLICKPNLCPHKSVNEWNLQHENSPHSRHKEDAGCISTNYSAGCWKIKGGALTSAIGMMDEDDEEQEPQPQAAQPQEGTSTMRGYKKEQ